MPRVRGYQQEVGLPDSTPRARFDAPRFQGGIGAAVARGAQGLGKQVSAFGDQLQETRDHEEAAASALKLQELLTDVDQYERGWERGDGEDATQSGDGMSRAVVGRFDTRVQEVAGQIANPQLRTRFLTQASEHRRRYADRTSAMEDKKLGDYFVEQNRQTGTLAANRMSQHDDPDEVGRTLTDLGDIVAGYKLTDQQKAALNRYNSAMVKGAYLDGQVARNPENVVKLLDGGFASDLSPDKVDQYRDEAAAAIRARDAQGRAELAQKMAVLKDELGAKEQNLNTGAGTAKDRSDLADQYASIGDKSKEAYWRAKAVEFIAVQGTKDLTAPQVESEIVRLTAKQGGKDGLTTAEAALLNGLKDQRTQMAARLNQDGGALAQAQYATGQTVTPLNPRDAASYRQRAREAEAAAGTYGRFTVEPFMQSDPQFQQFKDMVESGDPALQKRVIAEISKFGSARSIIGAATQLAGQGNGAFRTAAERSIYPAGPEVAGHILGGKAAIDANPGLWQRPSDDDPAKLVSAEQDARSIFAEYIPALQLLSPTKVNDTWDAAKAYFGSKMTASGKTRFEGGAFRNAIETVMGGYFKKDTFYSGSTVFRGQRVILPAGDWTGEGVLRRIARATIPDWKRASINGDPVWPDGSGVTSDQLRELVPVFMGGTRYGFRSQRTGNLLPSKKGGPYAIDIAKVPWR